MTTALVPGSFDPPTLGHLDVVARCASIFNEVLVAVIRNPSKSPLFSTDERVAMLEENCTAWDNVKIDTFDGLLVDFARRRNAGVIVKGLRAMTDFDYELQMAQMNRHLTGITTMFIATKAEYGYLSSSLVKEVAGLGGEIAALVPPNVARAIKERLGS